MTMESPDYFWMLLRNAALAFLWLLIIATLNQVYEANVVSVIPYLLPVVWMTIRFGLLWGFVFAAMATLASVPGDYANNPIFSEMHWAAWTYFKLSCVAAGVWIGGKIGLNQKLVNKQ